MQRIGLTTKKIGRPVTALFLAALLCSGVAAANPGGAGEGPKNEATAGATMSRAEVGEWVANLDQKSRQALFENEESFAKYLQQEATRKAAVQAVKANGFAEDAKVKFVLTRKSEELLLSLYVAQQLESRLDKNYPSAEEVKSYYEQNKEKLQLEERVALSQIFLAVPEKASGEESAKKAKELAASLQKGSISFAAAAGKNSDHLPSRLNGGFMGVLKVSELIPEVKNEILALSPGAVSGPVRSKTGWHIFKLSEKLAAQPLSLEEAEAGIRQLLSKAEQEKMGQKIVEALLAGKTVGLDAEASKKLYHELKEKQK